MGLAPLGSLFPDMYSNQSLSNEIPNSSAKLLFKAKPEGEVTGVGVCFLYISTGRLA